MKTQKLIDNYLEILVKRGGSDLHIHVGKPPFIRLKDGYLYKVQDRGIMKMEMDSMLCEIMDNAYSRLLEKEEIDITYKTASGYRFRVNIALSQGVPFMVFRELKRDIPTPDILGIPQEFVNAVENADYGLVIIVGTTGSGKSTTMASLMNYILSKYRYSVITIEDPIEYIIGKDTDAVSQREIGKDTKSFASALRAAMREDPDYIIVGEVRDIETARNAIIAAETGHIVFITIHSKSCISAIDRFCGVFPIEEQKIVRRRLTENVVAIMTQVLIYGKDNKRHLASEVLIPDENIKELLYTHQVDKVLNLMTSENKKYGWTMEQCIKKFEKQGIL